MYCQLHNCIILMVVFTSETTGYVLSGQRREILQNIANVVTSIKIRYHSNCIFLITLSTADDPDVEELTMLTELGKQLSKDRASNAIVPAKTYNYSLPSFGCPRNRPLNVMLSTNRTNSTSLSQISDVKGPMWIMFIDYTTYSSDLLTKLYVPISTEFFVARNHPSGIIYIWEVYQIFDYTSLVWSKFGNWTRKRGLETTQLSFFKRREDFKGMKFSALTTDNPPFTRVQGTENNISIAGFVGKVWETIEIGFNFSTNFSTTKEKKSIFKREVDGKWNKMITDVANGKVQFGIDALAMTNERNAIVDFTVPILSTKYKVYIRKPNQQEISWDTYFTPFSKSIWLTTILFIAVIAQGLAITQNLRRKLIEADDNQEDGAFTFANSLFYVYGLVCQQGTDTMPKSVPCRLAFGAALIVAVVVFANYSATLISFLTVKNEKLPFKNLMGLLHQGSYQLGVANNSAVYSAYRTSTDKLRRELYWRKMAINDANFPTTNLEGLQRICEMNYGFLVSSLVATVLKKNITCGIVELPQENLDVSLGIILGMKSPYRFAINHRILSMHEGGILKRLLWHETGITKDIFTEQTSVTIEDVTPILLFLTIGVVLATFILFIELCYSEWRKPLRRYEAASSLRQRRSTVSLRRRHRIRKFRFSNSSKSVFYTMKYSNVIHK